MNWIVEVLNPLLWGVAVIGAAFALFIAPRGGRATRHTAATFLALAAVGLLAALAVAAWMPPSALAMHPDGSTDDPRAITAVVLGLAALVALAPALRSLRLPLMGVLGVLLPGLGLAGLVASVSYFVGLRASVAIAGIAIASIVLGTGLALFARLRWSGLGALALQMGATGLLLVAAVLSLHGARAEMLQVPEGAAVDTLGTRVMLGAVEAPHDSLRRMEFIIVRGKGTQSVWAQLSGRPGTELHSVVAGGLFDGPLVVPLGLQEVKPQAHGLVWLAKGDTTRSAGSLVKFVGFRITPGDTIRMFADLDVTTDGHTERVSPGMYAKQKATTPFAAISRVLGPIAVGKIDADNGRIAIMLPTPGEAAVNRTALFSLNTRPALPVAWLGGALALLCFLLGFAAPPDRSETSR